MGRRAQRRTTLLRLGRDRRRSETLKAAATAGAAGARLQRDGQPRARAVAVGREALRLEWRRRRRSRAACAAGNLERAVQRAKQQAEPTQDSRGSKQGARQTAAAAGAQCGPPWAPPWKAGHGRRGWSQRAATKRLAPQGAARSARSRGICGTGARCAGAGAQQQSKLGLSPEVLESSEAEAHGTLQPADTTAAQRSSGTGAARR